MRELGTNKLHIVLGLATSLVANAFISGCGKDLNIDPPVSLDDYVIAQFDPSNPIPVFNLVTTPTALVQNPDGTLNVPLAECEAGTVKQCAQFAGGWAPNSPITFFFSGQVDPNSVAGGLKFLKLSTAGGAPTPVEFTVLASNQARPPPPEACKTQFNYEDGQVPPGVQVVIQPATPLDPATPYVVLVESYDGGGLQALEAPNPVVQPSALFYIMNKPRENAPVCLFAADGTLADPRAECNTPGVDPSTVIVDPLLRSQVQTAVINALPGEPKPKVWGTLTDEEKVQVNAAVAGQVPTLARLYGYFDLMINGLANAGAIDRSKLVFGTLWTTENLPAANLVFDPANSEVPFPNVPLLTVEDQATTTGLRVNLPVPADPGIQQLLVQNLNGLDGFSLFGSHTLSVQGSLDMTSLADSLLVYELDATGAPVGDRITFTATVAPTAVAGRGQLRMRPATPLKQATRYAIGITKRVKAANGGSVGIAPTYNLLKDPNPVYAEGKARDSIVPILQCSTVPVTGMLATPEQVNGSADALENQLNRARWQPAFQAFERLPTPISRTEMLIAWTYVTQNVTNAVDIASGALSEAGWEQLLAPNNIARLAPVDLNGPNPGVSIVGTASVTAFLQVVERFCIGLLCQTGSIGDAAACTTATACLAGTETDPQTCSDARAAVEADTFCTVAKTLLTSNVREIRRYDAATYRVTSGNPLNPTQGAFDPARFMQPVVRKAPVWVILPAAAEPNTGYPVTIFQHGITREKEDGFFIANSLAGAGQATVLMDGIWHGERVSDLVDNTTGAPCNNASGLPGIDPDLVDCNKTTNTCTARTGGEVCDGIPDPSGTGAIAVSPFTIRDGLRQATIDHLTLIRAIRAERTELSDLDPDLISYAGQSLGAIMGGNLLPYVPDLNAAALNVGGGSIVNLLFLNPPFASRLNPALVSAGVCELIDAANPGRGCQPTAAYLQFLSVVGWVVEPGDPLTTSIGVRDSRPVLGMPSMSIPAFGNDRILMQMAIPDGVVPNATTKAMGGVYGFDFRDNSATSHFQTYNVGGTDCHGFLLLPNPAVCGVAGPGTQSAFNNSLCATLGAQRQAAGFIASGGNAVPGRVFDPVPGVLNCPTDFPIQ